MQSYNVDLEDLEYSSSHLKDFYGAPPPLLELIDVVAIVVSWEWYAWRLLKNNSI